MTTIMDIPVGASLPLDTQLSVHGCVTLRAKHAAGNMASWLDITMFDDNRGSQTIQLYFPPSSAVKLAKIAQAINEIMKGDQP